MTANDPTLWQQWQQRRDPEAFANIVSRHSGMVYATCTQILGNAADAEDTAQDCFLELLNGRMTVRASLAPWLYTMAVRRVLNRSKSERSRRQRYRQYVAPSTSRHRLPSLIWWISSTSRLQTSPRNSARRSSVISSTDSPTKRLPMAPAPRNRRPDIGQTKASSASAPF